MDDYEFCELTSKEDILSHELLLYDAFVNRATHGWIYHHYIKDGNRMLPPFPYEQQLIFGIRHKANLLASLAVNLDTKKKLQLEYIGFSRKNIDETKKFAEILTLCTTGKHAPPDTMNLVRQFNHYLIKKYRGNGLIYIYGTTFIKKKLIYRRLGFTIEDSIENKYGKNLLLRQKIE